MIESEGRAGSTDAEKSCRGSDPTEENRDTRAGCTVEVNIFKVTHDGSPNAKLKKTG